MPKADNIRWHPTAVPREDRWAETDLKGGTVWLVGLSGSGKSTLANALEAALHARGRASYRLDGDNLRHGLNADLGFSAEDRDENIRRAGEAALLLADFGALVIASFISPFAEARARIRARHAQAGLPFLEVYVDTPLAVCEGRDPKGLYAKARAGQIRGLTGVDAPFEAPAAPELHLDGAAPTAENLDRLLDLVTL